MTIVVKKYGGKILLNSLQIKQIAQGISRSVHQGEKIIVVASAMDDKTDQLIRLAHNVSENPEVHKREYDMLLSTGEQISTALLTMALADLGHHSISFLGWQVSIRTTETQNGTEIESIDSERILEALSDHDIVVIAGFQGVDCDNNITVFRRGGSDLTAVALSKYFNADKCEIYKDTGGIYDTDPNVASSAELYSEVSYEDMLAIANSGAQVMQCDAIYFAKNNNVVIHIKDPLNDRCGTIISARASHHSGKLSDVRENDHKIPCTTEKIQLANAYESNVRFYSKFFPDVFVSARGSYIYNQEGKRYLDFFMGAGALNYGHNHPKIKTAVSRYLKSDNIIHSLDMHTPPHIEMLLQFHRIILSPRKLNYKIQFTGPTGADAVETAIKLARTYTQRKDVLYFQDSYHGLSLGALAISDLPHKKERVHLDFPDSYFFPYDKENESDALLQSYDDHLSQLSQNKLPAAMIVETIQGEGGVNAASQKWIKGIAALAKKYAVLFIVDDIQAGCGRSGDFFSFETMEISPDIICLSKSLSGLGLPLSMMLLKPHLDIWEPGEHTGTFRSNNLSLVASIHTLQLWEDEKFKRDLLKKAAFFSRCIEELITYFPDCAMKKKGRGFMLGIEWSDLHVAKSVTEEAFKSGLIIETSGKEQQVLKFLPPITITEEEIMEGINIIRHCVQKVCMHKDGRT